MSDSETGNGEREFSAVPKTEPDKQASENPPRRALPEGAIGIFLLLILAAVCGGLIALYWPWMSGTGADNGAMSERMTTLENRVGQIASGQAPKVAAASFEDMTNKITALKDRLDADEARLVAVEKSAGSESAADTSDLKAALDKNSADIAALNAQMEKLAQAPNSDLAGKVDANEKALAALRGDLDANTKSTNDALGKLDTRIAALEKTAPPADLAQRLDSFALKSGVAALDARLSHLENQDVAGLMRRAAALLALADLVRVTERETPFSNELASLRALMPGSPEIADLSQYAKTGAPTLATLTSRFDGKIDSILQAERAAQAHNWAERLWADFVGLVSVRRVGDVKGNDTEAHVARAEYALKHGDLAAAVSEVDGLDKPAKEAAMSWLKQARARLAINRDARGLTAKVVAALDTAPKSTGTDP